jgi:hypothetical protein
MVQDDLHMVNSGLLASFDFGYYKTTEGETAAIVGFWKMHKGDPWADPGALLAMYQIDGLPSGGWIFQIDTPGGPPLPKDVWMGVQFLTTDTGLLMYNPPTLGASDDLFRINGAGPYYFGGNPVANFCLGVSVIPEPAAVTSLAGLLLALGGIALRRR